MNNYLTKELERIQKQYKSILEQYDKAVLLQEWQTVKFHDLTENIFDYKSKDHELLMSYIDAYKTISNYQYNYQYELAKKHLLDLQEDLQAHAKNVHSRIKQVDDNKKIYIYSEIAFVRYFLNVLKRALSLIDPCLLNIQKLVIKNDETISSSHQENDIILLTNKCLIIYSTGLFKDECVYLLNCLTNKIRGRSCFSSELLYTIGSLNLKYRLYGNAICVLELLLDRFSHSDINKLDKPKKDMYFSANMMLTTCYEYSGEYNRALSTLMCTDPQQEQTDQCNQICELFERALRNKQENFQSLLFSFEDKKKQKKVSAILDDIFENDIFNNQLSKFVYSNASQYSQDAKDQNIAFENQLNALFKNEWAPHIKDKEFIKPRILQKYKIPEGKNKLLHDYLHLLAHCLNEEAVLEIKTKNYDLYRKVITLSRALMYYVSHNKHLYEAAQSYQSCYASVYAEAGEFSVARKIISELVNSKGYDQVGVSSKAEIDFFYYLFPRIEAISNSETMIPPEDDEDHYNHYLNCCYRSMDFDAISHMSVISYENKIAEILRPNDLEEISKSFYTFTQQETSIDEYHNAIETDNFNGHNIWLINEKKKLKYICRFLHLYLQNNENTRRDEISSQVQRNSMLTEYAYQYLLLCKSLGSNSESTDIPYITFSDVPTAISTMCRLLDIPSQNGSKSYEIDAEKAQLIISPYPIDPTLLVQNKAYFICDHSQNTNSGTNRYFNTELEAIREFFLYVTFIRIKNDFINPSRIFIMTPVNNAEPCKFNWNDEYKFIFQAFDHNSQYTYTFEGFHETDDQIYYSMPNPVNLSVDWIDRLSRVTDTHCRWALSFCYGTDISTESHYTLFFPTDPPLSAILYDLKRCKDQLSFLYKTGRPNKTHKHRFYKGKNCAIQIINKIDSPQINTLMSSFPEVPWEKTKEDYPSGCLLLWKDYSKNGITTWRIVFLDNKSMEDNDKSSIMQAVCNYGDDDPITDRVVVQKNISLVGWPEPWDIGKSEPYLFICHRGCSDLRVKAELKDFFVDRDIRFWYDRERLPGDWLNKVEKIINNKKCVGCVMLIMGHHFFSSSINDEIKVLLEKKNQNKKFEVIPVIYDCKDEEEFIGMLKKAYDNNIDDPNYKNASSLLELNNNRFFRLYLNKEDANSLDAYVTEQKNIGRDNQLIGTFMKLNVIEEKKNLEEEK